MLHPLSKKNYEMVPFKSVRDIQWPNSMSLRHAFYMGDAVYSVIGKKKSQEALWRCETWEIRDLRITSRWLSGFPEMDRKYDQMIHLVLKMIHLTMGHFYRTVCKTDICLSNTNFHLKTQTHSSYESSLKWPETRSSLSSSGLRGREKICWRISANLCRKEYESMNIWI